MEELKMLIEMVANLPQLVIWVLVGYLVYKVAVIGSIYGVIRLAIVKLHDWKVQPKKLQIAGKPISEEVANDMNIQLARLVGMHNYWHGTQVQLLKKVIDTMEAEARK